MGLCGHHGNDKMPNHRNSDTFASGQSGAAQDSYYILGGVYHWGEGQPTSSFSTPAFERPCWPQRGMGAATSVPEEIALNPQSFFCIKISSFYLFHIQI